VKTYRVPDSICINCGKSLTAASPVTGGRAPQPGDIAICLDCRHLQVYADDMKIRNLTDDEVVEVAGDEEIVLAMNMLGGFDKWRKRREE